MAGENKEALQKWLNEEASPQEKEVFQSVNEVWDKSALSADDSFDPDPEAGWRRLQLKVSMRPKKRKYWPTVAVASVVVVILTSVAFMLTQQEVATSAAMIHTTADQEVKRVDLTDGSKVWLSPGSRLSYATTYQAGHREVILEGKGFFEVEKVEGKRFVVLTPTTRTEVLGTSFNLESRPDGHTTVQVTTGKVAFASREKEEFVFLTPGEQASYEVKDQASTIEIKSIEDENYRAWQTQKLQFTNTRFERLISTLEDFYQTRITLSAELKNCRFTVSFDHQSLNEVFEILKIISDDLTVQHLPDGYLLSGKGCD